MAKKRYDIDDILGTAEAAEVLGVERPRIGRWIERQIMPTPIKRLKATPLWSREQIEALRDERAGLRRRPPVRAAKEKSARKRVAA